MPGTDSSSAGGDEKSHTFRKRRLSLTSRAAHEASSPNALTPKERNDGDSPPLKLIVAPTTTENPNADGIMGTLRPNTDESSAAESNTSDQKAHTFRKRRLSVTNLSQMANQEQEEVVVEHEEPPSKIARTFSATDEGVPNVRSRRASDASFNSQRSNLSGDSGLRMRTIHAGEIVGAEHTPPSPAMKDLIAGGRDSEETHVLYRQTRPSSKSLLEDANMESGANGGGTSPQPKWKKRIVRQNHEDDRKLPFPRDILGTYSCHGVEPVYDDCGGLLEGDDSDDEAWTEDISGAHVSGSKVHGNFSDGANKEPKPTTAAKINQDRGGVAFPYGNCAKAALFAVYDGHGQGGELVSQFALHEIQSRLEKQPDFNSNLEKAFIDTFTAVDAGLAKEPIIEPLYAGTTACVALLRDNVITCANAGDSRAVVARRIKSADGSDAIAFQAIDLTVDQNPDLPEERQRIESMGGFVSPPPEPGLSARVWLDSGFSQIGLAMARSIGDHAVAQVGVIATPVVTTHTVADEDEFLIIATDGVWEFITSEEAVEIVGANLSRGATKATQALIEAAAARWHDEEGDYRDDITALVVRLSELWKERPKSLSRAAASK